MKKTNLRLTAAAAFFFLLLPCSSLFAQINFTVDTTSGCSPLIANFQSQSTSAASWFWDFGVSTSTLENPGVIFSTPGSYDITLIVTHANGSKDTLTKSQYIQVYEKPIIDFGVSSQQVCARNNVVFTDMTQLTNGSVSQWTWDFGDGTTSTASNPTHVYQHAGVYPVSLFIVTQNGCSDDLTKNNYITVTAPNVNFSGDTLLACGPPLNVQFTSVDSSGTHFWSFGDGGTAIGPNPFYTYTQVGNFDVQHIVTDGNGCSDTLLYTNYVNIGVNTLSVSASDTSACLGDTIWFYTNATVRGTITWDFGDGNTSTSLNPIHEYLSSGTYTVTSSITDVSGCISTSSMTINVYDYPIADFSVVDTTLGCEIPFLVDFIYQGSGGLSWRWEFSNHPTTYQPNPTGSFNIAGKHLSALYVTGPGGCVSSKVIKDYITVIENKPGFNTSHVGGCDPLTVAFTDTSHSVYPIVDWKWSFGNGDSAFVQHPTYTFTDTGHYDITMVITNSHGCSDTVFREDYITVGEKPVANFVADTTMACVSTVVNFTNLSTGATSFVWYYGDNDTSMSYNARHNFGALGKMYVALVASDRGCTDTMIRLDYIDILAPLPIIGASEKKICNIPATVNFSNLSIGAHRYLWDFGNGDTAYISNPSSTFTANGAYPVSLSTWNDTTGCMATAVDSIRVMTVVSDFVVDTTKGCNPVSVSFTDSSLNAIQRWWRFENGYSTGLQNPRVKFANPGYYSAQLIVMNQLRCKDTLKIDSLIHSMETHADFSIANPSAGCVPLDLDFVDQSYGDNPVATWNWNFGDGDTSGIQNPSHTYQSPNYYTVNLEIIDSAGCTDSISKTDIVFATQPVPDFIANQPENCTDNPITFVSLATGVGLAYHWDFGDGMTSNLANPMHAYTQNGVYTVSLSVLDVNGCDSSITKTNYITINRLDATFLADTTSANCPPLKVTFTSATQAMQGNIHFHWDFGDGATSSQVSPAHNYTAAGVYDVTLIVSSIAGCADTLFRPQYINIAGPNGAFTFAPPSGCTGTPVTFSSTTQNAVTYQWLFGDGSVGATPNIMHTYPNAGVYYPALALTDSQGCQVFVLSPDSVEVFERPDVDFSASNRVFCDGGTVLFTENTSSNVPVARYTWDFGDGTTSTQQNPSHTYANPGRYTVSLTVENSSGCEGVSTKSNFIWVNASPTADFSTPIPDGCIPFTPSFVDNSTSNGPPLTQWQWDFGNSQTSTLQNPSCTYSQAGLYMVSFIITDSIGCQGSTRKPINAWPPPVVNFMGVDSAGCAPGVVNFTDLTQGATQWLWTFGDGESSQAQNPSHFYARDGWYTVSLQVWDIHGCTDSLVKVNYIKLAYLEADFSASESISCPGVDIQFTDLSVSDTTVVDWYWEFGDGNTGSGAAPSHAFTNPGSYTISLTITDILGCSHTTRKEMLIQILENVPLPPEIKYVSVLSDQAVEIAYDTFENTYEDFDRYILYRADANGVFTPIQSIYDINQTSFIDQGLSTRSRSYCYKVTAVNICGWESEIIDAKPHCSIELSTTSYVDQIALTWTPYVGWPVSHYQVFRVKDYSENHRELIGQVQGAETAFLDSNLYCPELYSYRVEALSTFHGHHSLSDTSSAINEHIVPQEAMHMTRATVENNSFVLVEWSLPQNENLVEVVVEKNVGSGFKEIFREPISSGNLKYQDKETEVSAQSYAYRASARDSCGDVTAIGREAKTMLLTSTQKLATTYLKWTPYLEWENGVDRYVLQVFNEATGVYDVVEVLPGYVTHFVDNRTELDQPTHCYRVKAFEREGRRSTSLSNESCETLDPRVYYPNAFTPNSDGFNDAFELKGIFVDQYSLKIYNRWGTLVFETTNMDESWDGTFKGQPVPEGVYVYVATGIGFREQEISRSGSITLIR